MLSELHKSFTAIDEDEDGIVSMAEFKRIWHEQGIEGTPELMEMFRSADLDTSGEIDYTEFIAACLDKRIRQQEEACWAAFSVFDLDGNGLISYEELHSVVNSAGMQDAIPKDTLKDVWRELSGQEF